MARSSEEHPTKKVEPWDRVVAAFGDDSEETTYAAVGRSLTAWAYFELRLATLFLTVTLGQPHNQDLSMASMLAFGAVRTYEGRAEMLRAAGEYFFAIEGLRVPKGNQNPRWNKEEIQALERRFTDLYKKANQLVARRNEIAHGIVGRKPQGMSDDKTFYLRPAYIESRKHDDFLIPRFSYGSKEMAEYSTQFEALESATGRLTEDIREMLKARHEASLRLPG